MASEIHRQTVDRAQRRFEQQLADSERELRWAVRQRRDQSSSPAEKRQATHQLQQLRTNLNNDYSQLIHVGELFFPLSLSPTLHRNLRKRISIVITFLPGLCSRT